MAITAAFIIDYTPNVKEILDIASNVAANNAMRRIANQEFDPLHRWIPSDLIFYPEKGNKKSKKKIREKMYEDRGGASARALYQNGDLLNSLEPDNVIKDFSFDSVALSSNVDYAAKHQYGGRYKVDILSDWDKYGVIFKEGQTVNITPRPFMKFETAELLETMESYKEVMKRKASK